MNENRYTETIGKLKLSDEALAKGIERMKNYEDKGKVVHMKSRFISIKTAVAAMLVLAVGVGAVFAGNIINAGTQPKKNTFMLTANAQELSYDNKIELRGFDGNSLSELANIYHGVVNIALGLQMPIKCEGTDIESVTYAVKDYCEEDPAVLCFLLGTDYAEKLSFENIRYDSWHMAPHRDKGHTYEERYKPVYVATEYNVAYEDQPELEEFDLIDGYYRGEVPVSLSIAFNDERESLGGASYKSFEEIYENNYANPDPHNFFTDSFLELFEKHKDEMKIYVTVNFTDGTSQTQTIQLFCEPSDDHTNCFMSFYGMLIEE